MVNHSIQFPKLENRTLDQIAAQQKQPDTNHNQWNGEVRVAEKIVVFRGCQQYGDDRHRQHNDSDAGAHHRKGRAFFRQKQLDAFRFQLDLIFTWKLRFILKLNFILAGRV